MEIDDGKDSISIYKSVYRKLFKYLNFIKSMGLEDMFFGILGVTLVIAGLTWVSELVADSGHVIEDTTTSDYKISLTGLSFADSLVGYAVLDDFQEYNLNKTHIRDAIEYNLLVQKVLQPYSKIGFKVGSEQYTLELSNGHYINLIPGIESNVAFTLMTSKEDFMAFVMEARKNDKLGIVNHFLKSKIPAELRERIVKAFSGQL